jgi:hypothetical protein
MHVFKTFPLSSFTPFETLVVSLSHPRRAVRESRQHRPHLGHRPSRAAQAPRSATTPGIPRTPRSHRPVRLTITAVQELTPVSENTQNNS